MMSLDLYSAGTDNHRNSGSRRVNMKIWAGVPSFNPLYPIVPFGTFP